MSLPIILRERARETAAFSRSLEETVVSGRGGFLFVRGGAGSGKSALLNDAAERAHEAGFAVVRIRGNHTEHLLDHNVALRVVRGMRDKLGPDLCGAFEEGLPSGVRTALDDRAGGFDTAADPRLTQALVSAMDQLVTRYGAGPVLLAIDNLHWMDRGSLRWLGLLLERLSSLPVLVFGSVCEGISGTDDELLEELLVNGTSVAELRPLGETAVGEILAAVLQADPDPAFTAAALRVTAGYPLLVMTLAELLTELGIRPDAPSAPLLAELATDSVAMSVRVRTRRISPDAFAVYRIVAALDGDATIDNVAFLSGIDPVAVDEVCHAMRKMGLLSGGSARLRAAQPLARNSVLRECPPTLLQNVHTQAASLLHDAGAPAVTVARHLLVVRRPLSEHWVVAALLAAASDAHAENDTGAYIQYLRRALIEPLPHDTAAKILTQLTGALARVDITDAAAHLDRALAASPSAVSEAMTPDLFVLLALASRKEQVQAVHRHTDADRRQALAPSMRMLRHLLPLGDAVPDEPAAAEAVDSPLSMALRAWDDAATMGASAEAVTEQALRATAVPGLRAEALVGQAFALRALAATGELNKGLRLCEAVVAEARHQGVVPVVAIAVHMRSVFLRRLGMLGKAQADASESVRLVRSWDPEGVSSAWQLLHAQAVHLLTDASGTDLAWRLVHRMNRSRSVSACDRGAQALYATGRLRLRTGDHREALRDFIACGSALADHGTVNPAVMAWQLHAAMALVRLGQTGAATKHVREHLEKAASWGAPAPMANGLRVRALVAGPSGSAAALEEAIDILRPTEERLGLAHALLQRGQQLRAAHDLTTARRVLREAHDITLRLDSPSLMASVSRELKAAGGRAPRSPRQGFAALTDSERRVAYLAAQGRKNREIAQSLFVQMRTVEIHLTNTYRKLGIGGRDELAAALATPATGLGGAPRGGAVGKRSLGRIGTGGVADSAKRRIAAAHYSRRDTPAGEPG
ncbi:BREX system ATP-binding domain-containing protein [Streptomyces sp. R39]|uniref:BREX system ATP-binding domain-containing protein n=1 Tax=Streptomyces sp. R39 TaxID=3238631 RepID=A0AB39QL91_9ACTN